MFISVLKKRSLLQYSISAFFLCFAANSFAAGGVTLGATRIIYPADAAQTSISMANHSDTETYLIQSWVSDSQGKKSSDFIVTPPLFVSHAGKENALRIELVGKPTWPADRESLYYLNSKAVPSVDKSKLQGNVLQFATQSVIKMFIRPKGLPTNPSDAPASLQCSYSANSISVNNPSPYYVSMVSLTIDGKKIDVPSEMVAPKSSATIPLSKGSSGGKLKFQTINDYGAVTAARTCG